MGLVAIQGRHDDKAITENRAILTDGVRTELEFTWLASMRDRQCLCVSQSITCQPSPLSCSDQPSPARALRKTHYFYIASLEVCMNGLQRSGPTIRLRYTTARRVVPGGDHATSGTR